MKRHITKAKRNQSKARSIAKLIIANMYDARAKAVSLAWSKMGTLHIQINGEKKERKAGYKLSEQIFDEIVRYLMLQKDIKVEASKLKDGICQKVCS